MEWKSEQKTLTNSGLLYPQKEKDGTGIPVVTETHQLFTQTN